MYRRFYGNVYRRLLRSTSRRTPQYIGAIKKPKPLLRGFKLLPKLVARNGQLVIVEIIQC